MKRFYNHSILLKAFFVVFLFGQFFLPNVSAQNSQNVNLLANWDNPTLPNIGGASYNDVWGYAANGREYAFIGTNADITVFDVTVATSPSLVTKLAGGSNSSIWRDFKTYQNYLYAISDQGAGSSLQIFDLSGLPSTVNKVYDSQAFFTTAHNLFVSEGSGRLYVAGANTQPNGVIMLDLTNPIAPVQIASFTLGGYTHDVFVHNDTLYSFMGSNGIASFDLASPYPAQLGALPVYPGQGYTHSGWADKTNKYLYVIEETHNTDIHIMDINNPANFSSVGTFRSALEAPTYTNSVPHNMMVRDSLLYVSYYHDGLQIWNISNPVAPIKFGYYDTFGNTNYAGMGGAWGIYAALPSGNILISDTQNGLFVLQAVISFPVTLTAFEAVQIENAVRLEWTTATESNSDRFELERSEDGSLFAKIGTVAAAGNSNEELQYEFIDAMPIAGRAYYRLKQIDQNGEFTFSEIRIVDQRFEVGMRIFPSPATIGTTIKMKVELPKPMQMQLSIRDMLGRKIISQTLDLHSGAQTIDLPTSKLAAGSFMVQLEGGGMRADKSLILVN